MSEQADRIIADMRAHADPGNREGMSRYGINVDHAYGLSMPYLRALAKRQGKDHRLALELWSTGVHEARILTALVDEPLMVTEAQMEDWVTGIDSWDICDQCCSNLFVRTPLAYRKAEEWSRREEEFVRRAGFVLMASLAVHDREAADEAMAASLPLIREGATDERNLVKKAVSWALRQIGKRDLWLNREAIACAEDIARFGTRSARWVASDALRELRSEAVRSRLGPPYR